MRASGMSPTNSAAVPRVSVIVARWAFASIVNLIPDDCPLIIESIIPPELIERELDAVSAIFGAATPQPAFA